MTSLSDLKYCLSFWLLKQKAKYRRDESLCTTLLLNSTVKDEGNIEFKFVLDGKERTDFSMNNK